MKTYTAIFVALAALMTTACEQLPGAENEAKREVRKSLIDPDSAKFESVHVNPNSGAVCGFVNGKNRMGAYAGSSPFVYEKGIGATLIQAPPKEREFERYFENIKYSDVEDYLELSNKCKGASLWTEKCGTPIFSSSNKYCDLINQGKTMTDVYNLARPELSDY
jgi:hypothetical protein